MHIFPKCINAKSNTNDLVQNLNLVNFYYNNHYTISGFIGYLCNHHCSLKDLNNVTDTRNTPSVRTISVSSSALFIIPDYLICLRYPRVCVTLRETKQIQKRLCIAILAFFLFSFWATETYETQPHVSLVSHDFPHNHIDLGQLKIDLFRLLQCNPQQNFVWMKIYFLSYKGHSISKRNFA